MNYYTRKEYKSGTIEFYFTFTDSNGFMEYLSKRKGLKKTLNALSVAISLPKNTVRVVVPVGTNEREFEERMNKFFQSECNMMGLFNSNSSRGSKYYDAAAMFGDIFGGAFK